LKKINQVALVGTLLVAVVVWLPGRAHADEIIVAAASSLADALTEIGRAYESKSGKKVVFNFGASSTLARQIDEGAPVDLFISADLEKMESLVREGRIEDGPRKKLLSNILVMVVPNDSRLSIGSPVDLLRQEVKRIALAEPSSVPVGIYARMYLEGEGIWSRIRNKIIPVRDARAALAAVESGNVDVGFVYKTDSAVSERVRVVYEVPREKGPEISYPVAVVKESGKKPAAGGFLSFLLGDTAKTIFRKYGFIVFE
jgi:molybdate transport system substrate-binding protein